MDAILLEKACPKCQKQTVAFSASKLKCSACDFEIQYTCPLCDTAVNDADIQLKNEAPVLCCSNCRQEIPLKKYKALIEQSMVVDKANTCKWCHAPTIHRPDANLSHRCFFFPKCSGQADLFIQKHEALIFLDFETTGLEVGKEAIIEIGALKIDEDGDEHLYQTFIKPPKPIDPRITKITGIDDDMVSQAPAIDVGIKELAAFIGGGKIVAHNADFDVPWLLTAAIAHGETLKGNTVICTLKWAQKNEEARASLGMLSKKYKIAHANAHRALADAVATRELYLIFENSHPQNKVETSLESYREACQKLAEKYPANR